MVASFVFVHEASLSLDQCIFSFHVYHVSTLGNTGSRNECSNASIILEKQSSPNLSQSAEICSPCYHSASSPSLSTKRKTRNQTDSSTKRRCTLKDSFSNQPDNFDGEEFFKTLCYKIGHNGYAYKELMQLRESLIQSSKIIHPVSDGTSNESQIHSSKKEHFVSAPCGYAVYSDLDHQYKLYYRPRSQLKSEKDRQSGSAACNLSASVAFSVLDNTRTTSGKEMGNEINVSNKVNDGGCIAVKGKETFEQWPGNYSAQVLFRDRLMNTGCGKGGGNEANIFNKASEEANETFEQWLHRFSAQVLSENKPMDEKLTTASCSSTTGQPQEDASNKDAFADKIDFSSMRFVTLWKKYLQPCGWIHDSKNKMYQSPPLPKSVTNCFHAHTDESGQATNGMIEQLELQCCASVETCPSDVIGQKKRCDGGEKGVFESYSLTFLSEIFSELPEEQAQETNQIGGGTGPVTCTNTLSNFVPQKITVAGVDPKHFKRIEDITPAVFNSTNLTVKTSRDQNTPEHVPRSAEIDSEGNVHNTNQAEAVLAAAMDTGTQSRKMSTARNSNAAIVKLNGSDNEDSSDLISACLGGSQTCRSVSRSPSSNSSQCSSRIIGGTNNTKEEREMKRTRLRRASLRSTPQVKQTPTDFLFSSCSVDQEKAVSGTKRRYSCSGSVTSTITEAQPSSVIEGLRVCFKSPDEIMHHLNDPTTEAGRMLRRQVIKLMEVQSNKRLKSLKKGRPRSSNPKTLPASYGFEGEGVYCDVCFIPTEPLRTANAQSSKPVSGRRGRCEAPLIKCSQCALLVHSDCYFDYKSFPPVDGRGYFLCHVCSFLEKQKSKSHSPVGRSFSTKTRSSADPPPPPLSESVSSNADSQCDKRNYFNTDGERSVFCQLCRRYDVAGGMVPTQEEHWVHLACMMATRDLYIKGKSVAGVPGALKNNGNELKEVCKVSEELHLRAATRFREDLHGSNFAF